MKFLFAVPSINHYGGIVNKINYMTGELREQGHEVIFVSLSNKKSTNKKNFETKLKKLEAGSEGWFFSKNSNLWSHSDAGWHIPVENEIPIFSEDAIEQWNNITKDVNVVSWLFLFSKQKDLEGFSNWWKFFDLPNNIIQCIDVADGYMDKKNPHLAVIQERIDFVTAVHLPSFNSLHNFNVPKELIFNSRKIGQLNYIPKSERDIDFVAFHIFKAKKHIDETLRALPYEPSTLKLAGMGIEYNYMTSKDKVKPEYLLRKKDDPDANQADIGKRIWERAEEAGMEYLGMLTEEEVHSYQKRAKFGIDASWSTHYAHNSNTQLNGFTIETIMNGAVPIMRDFSKLYEDVDDIIFKNLKAIFIPYDATPKEFAEYLRKAKEMSDEEYKEMVQANYEFLKVHMSIEGNIKKLVDLCSSKDSIQKLSCTEQNTKVFEEAVKLSTDFFKSEYPFAWENQPKREIRFSENSVPNVSQENKTMDSLDEW